MFTTDETRCTRDADGTHVLTFTASRPAISPDVLDAIERALDLAEQASAPLVIASESEHFAFGANLDHALAAAASGRPELLDAVLARYQRTMLRLRHASIPTVAAVRGVAVSGGCELLMHCTRVVAHPESHVGLAETSIGLIPGGGGLKELALQASLADDRMAQHIEEAFAVVAGARISRSAEEAKALRLLGPDDVIDVGDVVAVARRVAVALGPRHSAPPRNPRIRVTGTRFATQLIDDYRRELDANAISPYQFEVGSRVARVLCGADRAGTERTEAELLELERMHFVALARNALTQARIAHLRTTGEVLRN